MRNFLASLAVAAGLSLVAGSAGAVTATIKGDPSVSVDVPAGFTASDSQRVIEIKTPDNEVYVWFEVYRPEEVDKLIGEHEAYWKKEHVVLGEPDRNTDSSDGHKIIASNYKHATWKGDPTVVRYLFIDWGFPSHELILMSLWASPEGFQAHNDYISHMVSSIDAK